MDERLKSLMQDLGNAINESLSDSESIAEAIEAIKEAGYDILLVLEATIGFNKRDDGEKGETLPVPKKEEATKKPDEPICDDQIKFTTHDYRFLHALKIAVDEGES